MQRFYIRDVLGWGIILWLIGYVLGFLLFPFVSLAVLGWLIMPFGIAATWYVLARKVRPATLRDACILGAGWAVVAIVLDYFLLFKLLKPTGGYYRLDVYLYYALNVLLPVLYVAMTGKRG